MPALSSYDYALIRLVPRVEREECIIVGVILFCSTQRFLAARVALDDPRLLPASSPLASQLDLPAVRTHLARILLRCAGGKEAGVIGQLTQSERFHWLVSPRSTILQTSPVHSGLCHDPQAALDNIFNTIMSGK
jgi:hypothetical protein